jgi:nicotinate-nucleotide adenylyltransferase
MKIGLYFGSFNPIHIGHLIIASHIIDNTDLNQLWFVVSPHNPLKESSSLLNENQRYHLVQSAIDQDVRFRASNIEFQLPRPSYTIDTMAYFEEKYPQHEFAIIMGGDSVQNLPKWKNYQTLIDRYKIYVYKRPGSDPESLNNKNIFIIDAPLLDISATQIRNKIKAKQSIQYLVPDVVKEFIEQAGYYK